MRDGRRLDRRALLQLAGVSAGALALGIAAPERALGARRAPDGAFALGVASGAPTPDGVVLWARLAPDPLAADGRGGMPQRPTAVQWEVADDERFRRVVRRGSVVALPELAHAVHPQVRGLQPGRQYVYRFRVGSRTSPAGRTRTAPAPGTAPARLTLATASCQSWAAGHVSAHRHLAAADVDLVVFLGDDVDERALRDADVARRGAAPLGPEHAAETTTPAQYRLRYGLHKSDPHLRAAHASAPRLVTWDDHEVVDDDAGSTSPAAARGPDAFLLRRAAAYRAHDEHLPLPPSALPVGPRGTVQGRTDWGRLARLVVLDTRQHRAPAARTPEELADPTRSVLGRRQEAWFAESLRSSSAAWDVVASSVVVRPVSPRETDQWDGYPVARRRLVRQLARSGDPVVVSGDIHRHHAAEVPSDPDDPASPPAAVELVTSSIASGGDGGVDDGPRAQWTAAPSARCWDGRRGYVRLDLTPRETTSSFVVVPHVEADDRAEGRVVARFVTERGRRTLERA